MRDDDLLPCEILLEIFVIDLSIVVPVLGTEAKLFNFLTAIKNSHDLRLSVEVIIVDDASPIPLNEMFERFARENHQLNLTLITNEKNLGRAKSRNRGLFLAGGDIVLFLDVDNFPVPGSFVEIHSLFSDPEISAVRGNVRCDKSHLKNSAYIRFFDGRYLGARAIGTGDLSYRYFASDALALRRKDLLSMGGFDEEFKKYGCEDEELGRRYKALRKRFYFCSEAYFIDSDYPTLNRECQRMVSYARYSFPLLKSKHPGVEADALMHLVESDKNKLARIFLLIACRKVLADLIRRVLNMLDGFSLNPSKFFYHYVLASYYIVGYKARCIADKNEL